MGVIGVLSDPEHADVLAAAEREIEDARRRLMDEKTELEATTREIGSRVARREPGWTGAEGLARHDVICGPLVVRLGEIAGELAALVTEEPAPAPKGTRLIPERTRI